MRNWIASLLCGAFLAAPLCAEGLHFGGSQTVDVDVEFMDYAYKLPSGIPVYYLGTPLRYKVTLKNSSVEHLQAKTSVFWSENAYCRRWWYDGQQVSFRKNSPLPLNPDAGFQEWSAMDAAYKVPLEICPGQASIHVEAQFKDSAGRIQTAAFTAPSEVRFERR